MSNKPRKKKKLDKLTMKTKGFRLESKDSWKEGESEVVKAYVGLKPVGEDYFDAANKKPRSWRVTSFCDCKNNGGVKRFKTQIVVKDVYLNDLTDVYKDIKSETFADCSGLPMVDHGYFAEVIN